jgi:hypothetical protein
VGYNQNRITLIGITQLKEKLGGLEGWKAGISQRPSDGQSNLPTFQKASNF